MAKVTKEQETVAQENLEATLSKTDQFFKENSKTIWGCVIAAVVVAAAIICYVNFIYQPKCQEAMGQMYPAEINFQNQQYELALNGDGNVLGFAQVIDEYGSKAGQSAYLYAGICELQLGEYDQAVSYLKKYKGTDPILAGRAQACMGDAYVALEDYAAAVKCFEKAAAVNGDNMLAATYYVKAGLAYEALGKKAEALKSYKAVKDNYPQAIEAYDIDKYISRVAE